MDGHFCPSMKKFGTIIARIETLSWPSALKTWKSRKNLTIPTVLHRFGFVSDDHVYIDVHKWDLSGDDHADGEVEV